MRSVALGLFVSTLLVSPLPVSAEPYISVDTRCDRLGSTDERMACYILAQGAPSTGTPRRPQPIAAAAAEDATCTPQVTHRIGADLWWESAPATSGASVLVGYRLQRQVNDQRQWQPVADVAADVLKYTVDGVTPVVRPGNTYRYRVLALWQPPDEAAVVQPVVASEAGVYGEPQPCFQVLTLPPPGLLRATPKS